MNANRTASALSLGLILALVATTADAGARERIAKRKHAQGYSKEVQVQRTENGYTRSMEGTTEDGKTFSRDATVTTDKENGTWNKEVNGTLPNGKTYSTTVSGQKTDDGYTRRATHTGPNGGTTTRDTTVTKTENGRTKTVEVHHSAPQNGQSGDQ